MKKKTKKTVRRDTNEDRQIKDNVFNKIFEDNIAYVAQNLWKLQCNSHPEYDGWEQTIEWSGVKIGCGRLFAKLPGVQCLHAESVDWQDDENELDKLEKSLTIPDSCKSYMVLRASEKFNAEVEDEMGSFTRDDGELYAVTILCFDKKPNIDNLKCLLENK